MSVNNKPDRMLAVKRQINQLRKYKGTGKLIGTYRTLIEKQMTDATKTLAVNKSPWIIDVFEKQVNPAVKGKDSGEDVFDAKAMEGAIRSLNLFDRFLNGFEDMGVINDYIRAITALGHVTTRRYRKRTVDDSGNENDMTVTLGRMNIISIMENSLGVMENWELKGLENTMARLQMIEWSINCASRITLVLDGNGIPELDENGVRKLHATRNDIVFDYLNRGLFALGEKGGIDDLRIIRNLFDKLDFELEELVENHPENGEVLPFLRDINVRISCSILEQKPKVPEIIEMLIKTGVRGVETMLKHFEKVN